MNRHQGRRACCVYGHAGSYEPVDIGQPVGQQRHHRPGGSMRLHTTKVHAAQLKQHVIQREATNIHTNPPITPSGRNLSCILQCLPAYLQKHALLRIHQRRFTRGNSEKMTIESVDIIDLSGPTGGALANHATLRMEELLCRPALRDDLRHGVRSLHKHLPQRICVVRSSGKTAADTNDCNIVLIGHTKPLVDSMPPIQAIFDHHHTPLHSAPCSPRCMAQ